MGHLVMMTKIVAFHESLLNIWTYLRHLSYYENWCSVSSFINIFICTLITMWTTKHSSNTVHYNIPDSKVHRANMGPTWVLTAPYGPHVGPMNLAIRDAIRENTAVGDARRDIICLHQAIPPSASSDPDAWRLVPSSDLPRRATRRVCILFCTSYFWIKK